MTEFRPALVSNYTHAKRPVDVRIHYIVIHATELSYSDTIARFQSANQVSAHVVIRQADGHRTEMVAPGNVAWHAGNWDMNCRSLGIEQEAYIEDSAAYTESMMAALAIQIQEWSARYHVPLDRAHLLGTTTLLHLLAKKRLRCITIPAGILIGKICFSDLALIRQLFSL